MSSIPEVDAARSISPSVSSSRSFLEIDCCEKPVWRASENVESLIFESNAPFFESNRQRARFSSFIKTLLAQLLKKGLLNKNKLLRSRAILLRAAKWRYFLGFSRLYREVKLTKN